MNRLHYLTTDPHNAATAQTLAANHGLDLQIVEPRDLPRLERERAEVVLDWDFLPEDYQARLLNGTAVRVVAVHGFQLGESVAGFLPRRGILCGRRLNDGFFQALADDEAAA